MVRELQKLNGDMGKGRLIRIHPAWHSFIKFCENLKYGEIEKLKIQDGLPLMAEEVKKKIKFFIEE
jgi:hypothetical protein